MWSQVLPCLSQRHQTPAKMSSTLCTLKNNFLEIIVGVECDVTNYEIAGSTEKWLSRLMKIKFKPV